MNTAPIPLLAAAAAAVLLIGAGSAASAADRAATAASVDLVQSAAVTVVNNAPLQIALLTATLMPGGPAAPIGLVLSPAGGPGDESPAAGLVAIGGALNGTVTGGDAVSVSVGTVAGAAGAPGGVQVVIAQYN